MAKKGSITIQAKKLVQKPVKEDRPSKSESESSAEELDLSELESQENQDESDSEREGDSGSEEDLDSEEEDNDDNDDDLPKLKKRKGNPDDGSEQFSSAVNALLGTHLKAYDRKDPIFARSKNQIKKFETEKLELKARKVLLAEKKQRLTKDRVKLLLPTDDAIARQVIEREKLFKKTAQRGVIKLFNAILATQTQTANEISKEKIIGDSRKDELITEISKEKFLDLIQESGKD